MRLLLDTTYLMPLIKIKVREVSEEAIRRALREHEIIISEAQIFELYAKGAKYLLDGLISIEDLVEGGGGCLLQPREDPHHRQESHGVSS